MNKGCTATRDCLTWRAAAWIARTARIEWEMSRKKTKSPASPGDGKGSE